MPENNSLATLLPGDVPQPPLDQLNQPDGHGHGQMDMDKFVHETLHLYLDPSASCSNSSAQPSLVLRDSPEVEKSHGQIRT